MEIKVNNLTDEQLKEVSALVKKFEEENEKPKDVIDYVNGWIADGDIGSCTDEYSHMGVDNMHSLGLYRDTKEECEKLIKKMQIEHRLRQWSKMCKDKVDWLDYEQKKYYHYVHDNKISIFYNNIDKQSHIYFTDKSILKKAIADIGKQKLIDEYFVEI